MENPDVILVGAGIMSATLGVFLKELQPDIKIHIYERLNQPALESSDAWNNAGTGHSAFCELNYTPQNEDGSVDAKKAIKIAESFELSKQLWSYLVANDKLPNPDSFIHSIPHLSFVWGKENVEYLKKRYDALVQNPLFSKMQFSTDATQLNSWMPLVMNNRDANQEIAATYMPLGTDVNFGNLTRSLFDYLSKQEGVSVFYNHEIKKIRQNDDKHWRLKITNLSDGSKLKDYSKFVFIGAGGGSLLLLEKANVKEGEGFGGFPVSGQWLKCTNEDIIKNHHVKVYGKASVGAPPMSVPHLDTRIINGKKELLFGPYAGFSTKFLKNGSYLDLIKSLEIDNIIPMISAGFHNIELTKYLIEQVMQSDEKRIEALQEYFPDAKAEDWELLQAGQRVQVIKKDEKEGGILEFGTEVITTQDGTLACLLGASPGASTAVSIMIDVLNKCFKDEMNSEKWHEKLKEMIPSYESSLNENEQLLKEIRANNCAILKLNNE
ncbi:malate:quinone oxidoreductase [Flavobacterium sp. SUN052]|uniref:malate:quinone oxidoreductase n=1 Tax=Flavobacterium sp. SUN052 TaxID=3002441 RepID=UPI00237DFE5C|nr:malate:quinone oxidoreductase [Flavobacterium sp. SUN052]MEC4005375.1 malate:quinone oxidoreductase [Flavobacterium sp. SUN052]